MKTIKIKFCDFWKHWDENDNFIVNVLKQRYNVEISEQPDYIFFSNFNEEFKHMEYNNCVKIFYTQENIVPDFNYADYGIGYDYIEFGDRYIRYPIYFVKERYGTYWKLMVKKHFLEEEKKYIDRDFCSFVVSNGNADTIRTEAFEKLCNYKKVYSGGKYRNNIGQPEGVKNKLEFTQRHKFSLCFENTTHPGYSTEKLIEAFAAQTIPIYWGDPTITRVFNPNAFINATECSSVEELVKKVKQVDTNDDLYLSMLKTPALNEEATDIWDKTQNSFNEFLFHIFEQDKMLAIRRNMLFWGDEYHQRYYKMRNEYMKKNSFSKCVSRSIHKFFSRVIKKYRKN